MEFEVVYNLPRGRHFNYTASYVLSRTEGYYGGLFDADTDIPNANFNNILDVVEQIPNSNGLLPNDRSHIFKFFGSYNLDFGLTLGTSFFWQSGTPLNEYGATPLGLTRKSFLRKRGTAGRTPSLWDLNIRATYDLNRAFRTRFPTKLYLDILHLGSQRKAVDFDQDHFFNVDENGNQINENPNYLEPLSFQPPMTVRLGLEVGF